MQDRSCDKLNFQNENVRKKRQNQIPFVSVTSIVRTAAGSASVTSPSVTRVHSKKKRKSTNMLTDMRNCPNHRMPCFFFNRNSKSDHRTKQTLWNSGPGLKSWRGHRIDELWENDQCEHWNTINLHSRSPEEICLR